MIVHSTAIIALSIFLFACTTPSPDFPRGEWIDLTYDFSSETIYWVTAEPFKRTTVAEGHTSGGFYYSAYNFSGAEHGGTHIDSPIHFAEGKKTVDQIGVNDLVGPAVKIDVSSKALANRDYLITVQDIEGWESANGKLPDGGIVRFQTGFGKYWPDKKNYLGTDRTGPEVVAELHFPGLGPQAADWLVKNRTLRAVGIDTASIDNGQSTTFASHVALMTNTSPPLKMSQTSTRCP